MKNFLEKVESTFDITIKSYRTISGGYLNTNFSLETDKGKFFLKVYKEHSEEQIKEINEAECFFASRGIPVIQSIKNKDGCFVVCTNGLSAVLMPFVQGAKPERGMLKKEQIISLGKSLAEIHRVGAGYGARQPPFVFSRNTNRTLAEIEEIKSAIPKKQDWAELLLRR